MLLSVHIISALNSLVCHTSTAVAMAISRCFVCYVFNQMEIPRVALLDKKKSKRTVRGCVGVIAQEGFITKDGKAFPLAVHK